MLPDYVFFKNYFKDVYAKVVIIFVVGPANAPTRSFAGFFNFLQNLVSGFVPGFWFSEYVFVSN